VGIEVRVRVGGTTSAKNAFCAGAIDAVNVTQMKKNKNRKRPILKMAALVFMILSCIIIYPLENYEDAMVFLQHAAGQHH
jgi:hypothetical protein